MGISLGGSHCILNAFIDRGLIKPGNFTAIEGDRHYAFALTCNGIVEKANLTHQLLNHNMTKYDAVRTEIVGNRSERKCFSGSM